MGILCVEEWGLAVEGKAALRNPRGLGDALIGNPFLYRALRADEIEAGCVLIPKGQGPFAPHPRRIAHPRPRMMEEQAVRRRLWRRMGCPSRGVSTTPHLHRAQFYAQSDGIIVELDRRTFQRCWVREFVVNELLANSPKDITELADDEVILECDLEGALPEEIITRVVPVNRPRAAAESVASHYASGP
jgi:hypothetical protein